MGLRRTYYCTHQMRHDRVAVWGTTAVIVALTLATAPSVGVLSVPAGGVGSGPALGSGSADVVVHSTPDRATLRAGDYGDVYYLSAPPATVTPSNVTGAPILTASIDVDGLGYSRSSVFVLDATRGDRQRVQIERAPLNSTQIDRSTYDGRYRLVLHDDAGRTVIVDEPIVVEVTG